jgi:adenine/guanine phosphoribosyltransferase-like PRPP-binding protein
VRRSVLRGGDRVLFVDDWIATGGQAVACQQLAADAGAGWLGAEVIVVGMTQSQGRCSLAVRSLSISATCGTGDRWQHGRAERGRILGRHRQ